MKRAYTLAEMGVALAVVGLIAGAIVAARDMESHSRWDKLAADEHQYVTAVTNFRAAYHQLPGDWKDATESFNSAGGNGHNAACYRVASGGCHPAPTCDGNGDGKIGGDAASINETLRFWQHLSSADFISGDYIGTFATNLGGTERYVAGVTSPKAIIDGAYWVVGYQGQRDGNSLWPATGSDATPSRMTATDAYAFDRKFDDGWPDTGNIVASHVTAGKPCVVPTANGPAFSTDQITKSCAIAFAHAF